MPNIKEIPENCKHLVNIDDVVYVVPRDGACGLNCEAAFLFNDEVYGPQLRKKMNCFMAEHWNLRYKFITKCSSKTPFVRKLRGGEVKFTDPEELLKYLKESDEAAFMWTECEDLAVLSDMYQFRIKIITMKGPSDNNVSVTLIYPDVSLEQFAELKKVELGEMTLLHEDNSHFNLVINKNSDLACLGSLSFRFNIGPFMQPGEKQRIYKRC